jgi:hypothetical protein
MRRRDFIKVVAGSAATWPLGKALAQAPADFRTVLTFPDFASVFS